MLSPSWRGLQVVAKSLQRHQHLSMSVCPGAFSGWAAQPTQGSQMGQGVHVLSQGPRRPPAGLSPHCPRHEPPIHNPVLASFLSLTCSPVLKLCFLGPPPKKPAAPESLPRGLLSWEPQRGTEKREEPELPYFLNLAWSCGFYLSDWNPELE